MVAGNVLFFVFFLFKVAHSTALVTQFLVISMWDSYHMEKKRLVCFLSSKFISGGTQLPNTWLVNPTYDLMEWLVPMVLGMNNVYSKCWRVFKSRWRMQGELIYMFGKQRNISHGWLWIPVLSFKIDLSLPLAGCLILVCLSRTTYDTWLFIKYA